MKRFKKIILVALLFIVCMGVIGVIAFRKMGESGSGLIENWIGNQLLAIANGYLNPQLSFTDLDYQFPSTVSLKNLKLTADDPANPGKKIDIVGCGKVVLTLAEVPSRGKPIVIEKIVLDQPLFSAVAVAPKSKEFVGFSHLIRTTAAPASNPQAAPPAQPQTAPAYAAAPAPTNRPKLSDVFRMRLIQINDGRIVYDPRIPGTDPMELDKITTKLDVTPAETGWYRISTDIARKPVFDLSVAGQVNLDTFSARDMAVKLAADLSQNKLDYLPPQLQSFLRQYEIKGSLSATVVADSIKVMDPLKGELKTDLKLGQANVTLGEFRIPVDSFEMSASMDDGKATLQKFSIAALKGTANITGSATLNDNIDGDLKLQIAGMMLQQLLADQKEGQPMQLAGKLNANMQVVAPLKVVIAKVKGPSTQPGAVQSPLLAAPLPDNWGSGTVSLTQARLIRLPVVHGLTSAIATASKIVTGNLFGGTTNPRESLDITANFTRDQINVVDYNYVGDEVAARGNGTVTLDRQLNLKLYGGPVEKVEAALGDAVGGILRAVTDQLISYRVTGTMTHPQVSVEVAGGNDNPVVDTTKKAASGIGEGVGKVGESIGKGLDSIFKNEGQK